MAVWNRTDYDQLEQDSRWQMAIISRDPIRGIPPGLAIYLTVALGLLIIWR